MRRSLALLLVLGLAGGLLAGPRPALAAQDDLGMPVFVGSDPVPDEPVPHAVGGMMKKIFQKEKGGESYWMDRLLARRGADPAGTWLMSRGRAVFMKEHDPSVIGFGGRVAYWESIDDRDAYTIKIGNGGLTEDVDARLQTPSHWKGEYTGDGLAVTVKKFITHENVAVTTLEIANTGDARREVPIEVVSPYARTADGDRELTGVVTARNRLTTIFPRLSGDGLTAKDGALTGTLTIEPGRTARTKVQMGFITEELPGSGKEYTRYRDDSPRQALLRHLRDYNAWWAENLPYIDVPDENIKKFIYYRWWLMRFNYLDADIPGNDFQFPTSVEGALGYNNAIVLTVPLFVQELKYLRDPVYSYGPWVSAGEVSRNSKYTDNPGDPENWSNSYTQYISAAALESYQIHGGQPGILRNLARYAEKDVYGQLAAYDSNDNGLIEYDWEAMTGNDADAVSFHYYERANERVESAYVYANAQAAATAYRLIGEEAKAAEMQAVADRVKNAILTLLWDPKDKVFKHRDLQTGNLIPWKESNNYFPFNVGLVPPDRPEYREALRLWADPAEYPIFPTYTANQRDKAEAAAQGKPGTNNFSQLNSTRHFSLFSKALREYASPYITPQMYRQMLYWNAWAHFIGGDTRYPDANEFWADWDPATKTIRYRSWIHHTILGSSNWTIIEDVMGLRPRSDAKVELWPIDIGWDHFTVDNLRYRNVDLSIVWDRPGDGTVHYPGVPEGYSIFVDGKRRVTVDALVHTVWDPARREVTFPEGGGTTLFTADGRRPKAPTEHRLSGERIKDLFQKAGLDLDGAGPDLVREATASHGDPDGAVDGFTINEPHWSSKGSGRPRDWVEVDLGGARRVDTVRLYFYNDRAVNGHSEPALYTVQYLDGGTWREVPRQAKSPVYPRANLNEVRFPAIKTDRLRILVTHRKGYATGLKEIQVFSTGERPPAARNHAPYALVVQDPSYTRPAQARLNAVVKDDGLPAGELTVEWSKVDGPGEAFFTDPAGAGGTVVAFSRAGVYRLRLTVSDGERTTSETVTVEASEPSARANVAPAATPTASYTSPWEQVTAVNDGIDPPRSNDSANPRWGTWPQQGTQWVQLDWPAPVRVDGADVYFFDDGGGVRLPSAWTIQYWDGDSFEDVTGVDSYPIAADTYNSVSFDTVTTSRLRIRLEAGQGSLGLLEWKVYAVPPDGVRPVHVPTLAGTLPKLPGTVETFYADGVRGRSPVVWQPVTPDQVAEGGTSFTVTGLAEGVQEPVQATVHVRKSAAVTITSIADEEVTTRVGVPPSLPETVVATFNDGSKDSSVEVTWDDVDPDRYGAPGTFTVTGRVAGTTVRAKATVTVV
ncbi:Ig-like domain-containing protein [Thermostaphylospora chromogena]|uniref:Ig-like domain (Group 4) n=1 Tax=Thermostaphylospora chromogena TaxID=35622 RepID=A0A1H1HGY0_9ACTN|nr:Ig-like domain-containing protein [Thermostaphylospora chromogena]SDR24720.1 Ig-like domain (group 4) [Thermostaphylospora chromogena]